jgi:hypothetical protein
MTDRSMNYDLDGVFASRNQGQLISSTPTQRKTVRTPGLVPMRATPMGYSASIPFAGYEQAMAYQGSAGMGGWLDGSTNVPMVGAVSNKVLLGSVAAVGVLAFILFRK